MNLVLKQFKKVYRDLDLLLQAHLLLPYNEEILWELFESTDSLRSCKDLPLNIFKKFPHTFQQHLEKQSNFNVALHVLQVWMSC